VRAGLLSQPEVIQTLNERFVCTTINSFDLLELAKKKDELAGQAARHWSYPVCLMLLNSEGKLITKLNPIKELTDIHPDTDQRPGQRFAPTAENNTRVFLKRVDDYFGKTP
jgi:hypothetical protein